MIRIIDLAIFFSTLMLMGFEVAGRGHQSSSEAIGIGLLIE